MEILYKSFKGLPSTNQDYCKGIKNDKEAITAVADGLQPSGKVASQYAINQIVKEDTLGMDSDSLRNLIIEVNKDMVKKRIGKTTLTVIHTLIEQDGSVIFRCFNSGDTRAYVLYGNRMIQLLTKDHRTNDCYGYLTSCLGDSEEIELHYEEVRFPRGHIITAVILSDGAWEYLLDRDRCYDKHTEFVLCSQWKRRGERYAHLYGRLLLAEKEEKLQDNATFISLEIW